MFYYLKKNHDDTFKGFRNHLSDLFSDWETVANTSAVVTVPGVVGTGQVWSIGSVAISSVNAPLNIEIHVM